MRQTFCHRLGLVATIALLLAPTQTAHARSKARTSKARTRLLRYDWVGNGTSRGGSPLSLELKFERRATRAALSVYWPRYRKYTARRVSVRVGKLTGGSGLKIKDRFTDGHPIYKYRSSTGIYCHIPSRDLLRTNQFRCKVQYSGWILMHRKGVALRPMKSNPPARPPSLKRRPSPQPPTAKRARRSPGSTGTKPGRPVSRARRKPSIVGCWMKSGARSGPLRKIRSLRITQKGRFRWIRHAPKKTLRGRYSIHGSNILLLNAKRTRGTRWRFTLTRCMPRRPYQPCLRLHRPQSIRRTRRGKITHRGRVGTKSHLFMRVGTHPNCR